MRICEGCRNPEIRYGCGLVCMAPTTIPGVYTRDTEEEERYWARFDAPDPDDEPHGPECRCETCLQNHPERDEYDDACPACGESSYHRTDCRILRLETACRAALGALNGAVTQHSRGCASVLPASGECDCWLAERRGAIELCTEILYGKAEGQNEHP